MGKVPPKGADEVPSHIVSRLCRDQRINPAEKDLIRHLLRRLRKCHLPHRGKALEVANRIVADQYGSTNRKLWRLR